MLPSTLKEGEIKKTIVSSSIVLFIVLVGFFLINMFVWTSPQTQQRQKVRRDLRIIKGNCDVKIRNLTFDSEPCSERSELNIMLWKSFTAELVNNKCKPLHIKTSIPHVTAKGTITFEYFDLMTCSRKTHSQSFEIAPNKIKQITIFSKNILISTRDTMYVTVKVGSPAECDLTNNKAKFFKPPFSPWLWKYVK